MYGADGDDGGGGQLDLDGLLGAGGGRGGGGGGRWPHGFSHEEHAVHLTPGSGGA
ncbi:hypothetical protein Syun_022169 [Stephania yunnanensis]|uniref:Uncharacterized protein n=1 Tax=Stephania yunnanensis TaxID=152371 RepID=A0AAP0NPU7_9MAGN